MNLDAASMEEKALGGFGVPRGMLADVSPDHIDNPAAEFVMELRLSAINAIMSEPRINMPIRDAKIDVEEGVTLSLLDCPSGAIRMTEYGRGMWVIGNSVTGVPCPVHLLAVVDKDNAPLGSVALVPKDDLFIIHVTGHDEAMRASGIRSLRPLHDDDVVTYLRTFEDFFGDESKFTQYTRIHVFPKMLPPDSGFGVMQILAKAHEADGMEKDLYSFIARNPMGLYLLGSVSDTEQATDLIMFAQKDPLLCGTVCDNYFAFTRDIDSLAGPSEHIFENPVLSYVHALGLNFFLQVAHASATGIIDDELVHQSTLALRDVLNTLYAHERGLAMPRRLPDEGVFYEKLVNFASANAQNPEAMQLVYPIIEQLWVEQLKTYVPGKFEESAGIFYDLMGDHLYKTASETTGDTEKQLLLLDRAFEWLVTQGYWNAGDVLLDAGSGPGERILHPFLLQPIIQQYAPGKVYAVDKDPYPQPSHALWQAVQKSFIEPDFTAAIAGKVRVVTHLWSPINDLDGIEQQVALNNLNQVLEVGGFLLLEAPADYVKEMKEYSESRDGEPLGKIVASFSLPDGQTASKEFFIGTPYSQLGRILKAGFVPINYPPDTNPVLTVPPTYVTKAGKERMMLILQKVREPEVSLDQVVWTATARSSQRPA